MNTRDFKIGLSVGLSGRSLMLADAGNQPEPGGGAVAFNIAYGDTAPADTSKLWVKTDEPDCVAVAPETPPMNGLLEVNIGSLPEPAAYAAAAAVDGKIYLFGGWSAVGHLSTINVFDTDTNTISTLDVVLPAGAQGIASAAIGSKIYLFGGALPPASYPGFMRPLNTINVFDTNTNTISTLDVVLPTAVLGIASAAIGSKIYLFGGSDSSNMVSTINVFDANTNTISTLDVVLPTAAYGIASAAIGNKIYLFGGSSRSGRLAAIHIFDTEKHTITTLDTILPKALSRMASTVIGDKIYLFGGSDSSSMVSTINVFDTNTNTISTLDVVLPTRADGIASAAINNCAYLFGGVRGSSSSMTQDTINKFLISFPLSIRKFFIETDIAKNLVNLVSADSVEVEIGIKNVYLGNSEGYAEKVPAYLYRDGAWVEV
jgi:N-acetylneuraminic acid mutarotase